MDEFYKSGDKLGFEFAKFPKYLLLPPYCRLSNNAKLLYVLMLDRLSLSLKNDWADVDGRIYIFYSREQMMQDLNISSKSTIIKAVNELIAIKLISEEYFSFGFPKMIFISKI